MSRPHHGTLDGHAGSGAAAVTLRHGLIGVAAILVLGLLLWSGVFIWFVVTIPAPDLADRRPADAIVVLTGGSERVGSALQLLNAGMAPVMFISGVNQDVDLPMLLRRDHLEDAVPDEQRLMECCIMIGHAAGNTRGNAMETAAWLAQRSSPVRTIRLVTANYHMRRSMAAFAEALPNVEILPWPVVPHGLGSSEWWQSRVGIVLMATEATKYLNMKIHESMR